MGEVPLASAAETPSHLSGPSMRRPINVKWSRSLVVCPFQSSELGWAFSDQFRSFLISNRKGGRLEGHEATTKMDAVYIVKVEQEGEDGVLVTFSDGTIAGYVAEELIELRPIREKASETTRRAVLVD